MLAKKVACGLLKPTLVLLPVAIMEDEKMGMCGDRSQHVMDGVHYSEVHKRQIGK